MKTLFINRKDEIKQLTDGLINNKDYVIIAPRRYGKTTLVNKVLNNLALENGYVIVNIDLMSYTSGSIESVAECIIEKSLNTLGFSGKLRKIWDNMDFTFNLRLKYQDLEIDSLFQLFKGNNEWELLEKALELPEKIAKFENKKIVVFYDEFGELNKLSIKAIELFYSVIQRHKNVSYVFSGSQETVMNKIFLDKAGAFYRFGEIMYLKGLSKQDVYTYIHENFSEIGNNSAGLKEFRNFDIILEQLNGHPLYIAQAVSFFKENPKCTYEEFHGYLINVMFENTRPLLEQQLINISEKQHAIDVLRILAFNQNPYQEINSIKESHVGNVLRYLENAGYIRRESRGVYKITDPLLTILLNNY